MCDATDDTVVRELRRRKMRDDKPFAVMVADVAGADALCEVSAVERRALTSPTRPVVLLRRRVDSAVADAVAPRHTLLGVMLPYTPLQHLLLHDMPDRTLVMTSGNRSDEPIVHHDGDLKRLSGIPDFVLTHDRPIHLRCDDSVVRVVADAVLPVRRARGEAPRRFRLRTPLACPTLALGGHLKAAVALGQDSHVVPSHHLGDLDDYQAYRAYVEAIEHYQRLFRIVPHRLVHDLHPDYASSRYALERAGATAIGIMAVQHHHAHMASCMAEHGLAGPVIGVCFDGTGWGTDGAIWGGEFLLGDDRDVQRAGHLDYVAMPGGETAIREPWRMALAHLIHAGEPIGRTSIARRIDADRIGTVEKMFERNFNAPLTSSVGRLFDAVAALVGVCDRVTYEGQAAMALESLASQVSPDGAYPFALLAPGNRIVVDPRPLIRAIIADARDGIVPAIIARRFHSTLVDIVATVCDRVRAVSGVTAVVLSGGVFVNGILAGRSARTARLQRLPPPGRAAERRRPLPGTARDCGRPRRGGWQRGGLMCLGVPGLVVATFPEHDVLMGKVDFGGIAKQVCLAHVPDVRPGDYVLVHVGFALARLDEAEARRVFEFLEAMNQLDELGAPSP